MINENERSLVPTKTLWGISTSITIVNNFLNDKNQAIDYVLKGRDSYPTSLPNIIDITKYDYYDELGGFNDVISVQGLKNWSNRIPYFQMFKDWENVDKPKLNTLGCTAYGMKQPYDNFYEAGFYYLDHVSPYLVATSLYDYNGTTLDDIYKAFECPKVINSHSDEVRCYKEMPHDIVKELKL